MYLKYGAKWGQGYYCSLIKNRTRAFDWHRKQWPWTILNAKIWFY